jgi:hypothetical protein
MQCPYCFADTSSALPRCARCNRPLPQPQQQPPADLPQYEQDVTGGSSRHRFDRRPGLARSLVVVVAVAVISLVAGVTLIILGWSAQLVGSGHSPNQKPIAVVPSSAQLPSSDVSTVPSIEDDYPSAPDSSPTAEDASAVVEEFYQDINNNDFTAAWELGGKNIANTSYAKWAAGFDTTENVEVETTNTEDSERVGVVIRATQSDGSVKVFHGTYTVSGGEIVNADIS